MKRLTLLAMLVLLPAPVLAQTKLDDRVLVENDVVFGKGGDQELKLDLAMPKEGSGPFPAVVCVHGGGWKGGNYKQMDQSIKGLAGEGFVAITIQYRLTPKGRWPDQIEDCKCAVRWLRANAQKYKVKKDAIGAIGFSAGGHLVCLLGLTTKEDGLEGKGDLTPAAAKESSRVQAVVDFFGPTDLTTGDWEKAVEPLLVDLLGGTLKEKPENYKRASPLTYVRKDKDNPAVLMFHGTTDNIVHFNQSEKLLKALKEVHAPVKLVTMEGEGHGWMGDKLLGSIKETVDFLNERLKKGR